MSEDGLVMSAGGSGGAGGSGSGSAPATTSGQQFGTLWIQDQNGVSQMVRVLQATPTKTVPAAAVGSHSEPAVAAGPGVVRAMRAIIKTGAATGQPSHVVRRVQLQQSGQAAVLGRPSSSGVLGPGRVLTLPPQRAARLQTGTATMRRAIRRNNAPKRRVLPSGPLGLAADPDPDPESPRPALLRVEPESPPGARPALSGARAAFISPILDHSGARKRQGDADAWMEWSAKRRRTEKTSKGLRHFSMKVCEKVRTKGVTTYNEVADELVAELSESGRCDSPSDLHCDQKNIRRRVYDALNVLMAMNIISKERKEIKWLGLPTNSLQECRNLQREKADRMCRINQKTQQLKDLILQQIAFKNLVERNRKAEEQHGAPPPNSTVQLPFIIVNTSKKTVIDCSISNDKMEYLFNFDDTFEIHDDIEVLKRMGLALGLENGTAQEEDVEKAKAMVPPSLAPYIDQLARDGADPESSARGLDSGASTSERGDSATPSIDFDTDEEEEDEEEEEEDEIYLEDQ